MTLDERIAELRAKIKENKEKRNKDSVEARSILESDKSTDEQIESANKTAESVRKLDDNIKADEETLRNYEAARKAPAVPIAPNGNKRALPTDSKKQLREAQNLYLKADKKAFRADDTLSGLVSTDVGVTIPEDISYIPQETPNTVSDLKPLVNSFPAKTASGKYPVADKVTDVLHTKAELEKHPELAKPTFTDVDWKVDTYSGAMALSQESIDDSAIDLVTFVGQQAIQKKVNTTNAAISKALISFTPKAITGDNVDELKHIINVDLDRAYKRDIVVTQTFYNWLDTLKDKNGQYLLKPAITDASPERLLGLNVYVVEDILLGNAGESHAWIGDLKRAILFADRKELQVRWVDNDYFSQDLAEIIRFGVTVADKNAGYFLTQGATTSTTPTTPSK